MPPPPTLLTRTPAEGQALARQLATDLLANVPEPSTMPEHLKTSASRPSLEVVIAIYFHAIALANHGWAGASV